MIKNIIAAAALFVSGTAAYAAPVTISLGASSELLILYGQGNNGAGRGTYTVEQGASSFDGTTSTFVFTGAITGSSDPRFTSGTYEFVTTYDGPPSPEGGPNAPRAISNLMSPEFFNYSALDSSTIITLFLDTPGGDFTIPLFDSGFLGGFGFLRTSSTCSGVPVASCTQLNVGLTDGAIISGPVTISVNFDDAIIPPPPPGPVPAPAALALFGLGLGVLAAVRRAGR